MFLFYLALVCVIHTIVTLMDNSVILTLYTVTGTGGGAGFQRIARELVQLHPRHRVVIHSRTVNEGVCRQLLQDISVVVFPLSRGRRTVIVG